MVTARQTHADPRSAAAEQILQGLSGSIEPVRRSGLYAFGLVIVAVAMLILPLVYLALIAGVAYATYLHAVYDVGILAGGVAWRGRLVAYAAPLVAGVVLILFMIKPLFARRARNTSGLVLDPDQQPLVFEYVRRLCGIVGAPVPRAIMVDCDVNASASLRRGLLGLFSRDVTLTIGLPLVIGLSLRELTGVLAHELGHFSQGLGMRLCYVIRATNAWFARVVYERDRWDQWLAVGGHGWQGGLIVALTRLCIWLTRRILWVLMMLGHGISSFMSRRMEYDADRYEARVAGSDCFATTSRQIRLLHVAGQMADKRLSAAWRERRLADNLPGLIASELKHQAPELVREIDEAEAKKRTRWLDSHPCEADRIRNAAVEATTGIIRRELPATALFRDFEAVCQTLSFVHYRDVLGEQVERSNLVPTAHLLQSQAKSADEQKTLERYLGHGISACRPVRISDPTIPETRAPRRTLTTLRAACRRIHEALPRVKAAYEQYEAAETSLREADRAELLCRAKVRFDPAQYHLPRATPDEVEVKRRAARTAHTAAAKILASYEAVRSKRLVCALQLLGVPALATSVEGREELLAEARQLLFVLARLDAALQTFTDLRETMQTLLLIDGWLRTYRENATLQGAFRVRIVELLELVRQRRNELRDVDYPFEHAAGAITVAQYLLETPPLRDDPETVLQAASAYASNLTALYFRVLGRLASLAAQVEAVVVAGDESGAATTRDADSPTGM